MSNSINVSSSTRLQKLPPALWTNLTTQTGSWLFYYPEQLPQTKNGKHDFSNRAFKRMELDEAMQAVARADKAGKEAYVSTFIDGQQQVVCFSYCGRLEELSHAHSVVQQVEAARQKIRPKQTAVQVVEKPEQPERPIQIVANGGKNDHLYIMVNVDIGATKLYSYKCRQWHFDGELVCVKLPKKGGDFELRNVPVVGTAYTKWESELDPNINWKELYCEYAVEL